MIRLWSYVSYLGTTDDQSKLERRSLVLNNRVNFVLLVLLLILSVLTAYVTIRNGQEYNFYSSRLPLTSLVCLANLVLANHRLITATKLSTVFLPISLLILVPIFFGYIQDSSFFYYHVVVICLSLIPQLVFTPRIEKRRYWFSLAMFFILMLFLDDIMVQYSTSSRKTIDIIDYFRIYYKVIPVAAFVFLHLSLFYLRNINSSFELDLLQSNEALKKKVEELSKAQQRLIQSEKMASMGTMVAGISHEINNPLNYISGGLDLIKRESRSNGEGDIDLEAGVEMIQSGVSKASDIVNKMKSISYHSSDSKENVTFQHIVEDALLFIAPKLSEEITIETAYEFDQTVSVNTDKLHQVVQNILDNAIHATLESGDPPFIRIRTTETVNEGKSYGSIEVFNTGVHIPSKNMLRIFDPFFTTKDPGQGTGLGLSICYSLVGELNGFLSVSNEKEGVSFSIQIPARQSVLA